MANLPWFNIGKVTQSLKEAGMLECISHLRSIHSHWECAKDMPFTSKVRHTFVKGAPVFLKISMIGLFHRPDLTKVTVANLGILNVVI